MPNVKWRTDKKSFRAFDAGLLRMSNGIRYLIHMNDIQQDLRAAELYDGVPHFAVKFQH